MGPRLVSRGNVELYPYRLAPSVLQWGHGLLAVEMASMGPRLVSRGNSLSLTR